MSTALFGVLLSFGAMFGWAFGDFFIQKTGRAIGAWNAMFWSGAIGILLITPLTWSDIPSFVASATGQWLLLLMAIIITLTVITSYISLVRGKLSVVTPIFGLEVPFTVIIGFFLLGEHLTVLQTMLVLVVFSGIAFGMTHGDDVWRKRVFERGALIGLLGAFMLAVNNVLIGYSSRVASPLMTLWFAELIILLVALAFHFSDTNAQPLLKSIRRHPGLIVVGSLINIAAWLSFGYAARLLPIAVATTISEGYIALGVVIGIVFNRETLKRRQKSGILIAVVGILALSALTAF